MSTVERVRAFVAITPSLAQARKLSELQQELRKALGGEPEVAWVPPPNLHVTLKFFGSIPRDAAPAIADELRRRLAKAPAVSLTLRGVSCFPEPTQEPGATAQPPRVLWAALDSADGVVALARDVESWMGGLGFAREERPFRPHVTLARVRPRPVESSPPTAEVLAPVAASALDGASEGTGRKPDGPSGPFADSLDGSAEAAHMPTDVATPDVATAPADTARVLTDDAIAPAELSGRPSSVSRGWDLSRWREVDLGRAQLSELVLYESRTTRLGSEYIALARVPLGARS